MDRNISEVVSYSIKRPSLSARRAWIEIVGGPIAADPIFVALRKESVDRNKMKPRIIPIGVGVALRKESVDRNTFISYTIDNERVALRKESVDRNRLPLFC